MADKEQQLVIDDVRVYLRQIALELEAAAEGARTAAEHVPDRQKAWGPVQQMYTRLAEAEHLVSKFKTRIDDAISAGGYPPER